jgi:hypothetical protein
MAAHRQYVPLRDTEGAFRIEDGTMCRMPSPRPGPLRWQQEREPLLDFVRERNSRFIPLIAISASAVLRRAA